MLYDLKGEVPDEIYTIPLGVANYTREGEDVTIIALSAMVHKANRWRTNWPEGISVEVVDPRTIRRWMRKVFWNRWRPRAGRDCRRIRCTLRFAHDVAALIASQTFHFLKAPVLLVTPPTRRSRSPLLSKNSGSRR